MYILQHFGICSSDLPPPKKIYLKQISHRISAVKFNNESYVAL